MPIAGARKHRGLLRYAPNKQKANLVRFLRRLKIEDGTDNPHI